MKLFLKAHTFSCKDPMMHDYLVRIEVNPKGPSAECDCSGNPINCFKIFTLECEDQYEKEGDIKVILYRKKMFGRRKVEAEVSLPLMGFEVDRTVRNVYPTSNPDFTADIEVHLSSVPNVKPFSVPAGKYQFSLAPALAGSTIPAPQAAAPMGMQPSMPQPMQQPTLYAQPEVGVMIQGQNVSYPGQYVSAEQMNPIPPPIPPVEEIPNNPYAQSPYNQPAPQYSYAQNPQENPYQ
ncbi:hypothetical protein TVAG_224020 [Trichomonas vaginalis G3]|uniref:Uncharacterized protein n=1 Tax=Trichomonas vaginalis (strain ATCC PRA-98 / G3) TaxID=412133 RepID=A2DW25_TRIV3|nr:hypothetical protein TVAGG3_0805220 [Trichomonas vaginalis G3]EAY15326.1 hypothetical protein TVAG_224020 [Trichomonas vaginalis G3]KAI5496811.1 hypothetical protein TVAGG3_0805220 [Trichomonas vaginalis G3]|eukprot:XP_001327549.1 hypothetical protein [Trichomonas vaginalis G3]